MIRITNEDGTGCRTKFLDGDTGADIGKGLAVEYGATIRLDETVTAELTLMLARIDMVCGKAKWMTKNPLSGGFDEVTAIEFADGTRVELHPDRAPTVIGQRPDDAHPGECIGRFDGLSSEVVQKFSVG